jgi:hypothetical protein
LRESLAKFKEESKGGGQKDKRVVEDHHDDKS